MLACGRALRSRATSASSSATERAPGMADVSFPPLAATTQLPVCLWQYPTFWRLQLGQGLAPTPVEPPLPETLVNSVLSISFNTPDCLIVTIGTVCENQDTSVWIYGVKSKLVVHEGELVTNAEPQSLISVEIMISYRGLVRTFPNHTQTNRGYRLSRQHRLSHSPFGSQ